MSHSDDIPAEPTGLPADLLWLLRDVAEFLASCRTQQEAAAGVLETVLRVPGIDCGGIYLIDPDSGALHLVCHHGLSDEFVEATKSYGGDSERAEFVKKSGAVFVHSAELGDLEPPKEEGLRALAIIPTTFDGNLVAVMNLASHTHDRIPGEARAVLEPIAAQLGGTIGRTRAEEALRRSEERYRTVSELTSDYAYAFEVAPDGELLFSWVTGALNQISGYEIEELAARGGWEALVHPEDHPVAKGQLEALLAGRESIVEYRIIHRDGSIRWMRDIGRPVRDEEQERTTYIHGAVQDITLRVEEAAGRRRLEAQVRHAQKLESLGVLAGGIAHDFNNLLVGILGRADLALRRGADGTSPEADLAAIRDTALQARSLCRQLLAYAGKGRVVVEPLDVSRIITGMRDMLRVSTSRNVELNYQLESDLPAIEGDADQIRQVVLNLVTNSSEAIGDEAGSITVRTGVMHADPSECMAFRAVDPLTEGKYVCLDVSDTGPGMDPEMLDQIFDPFYSTKFQGRGLGLSAVEGVLRSHRGGVEVRTSPGQGCSFRIAFPASDARVSTPEEGEGEGGGSSGGGFILLVDDEPVVRSVGTEMLKYLGFDVVAAEDGVEAVRLFEERGEEFRAVVLDLTMPRMSGQACFRALRASREDVRILVCSGYSEEESVAWLAGEPRTGFLQKPFEMKALSDALSRILA